MRVQEILTETLQWETKSQDGLRAYASQWEDMMFGVDPEELIWHFVPAMPLALFGSKRYWQGYWREQEELAAQYGDTGRWDYLLGEEITDPVVVGIYAPREFSIWDGNHRVAASVLSGRKTVPAVVGVLPKMGITDLPPKARPIMGPKLIQP